LKKPVLSPTSHFNIIADEKQIEKSSKGFIPKNTNKSTSCAICTFQDDSGYFASDG